jgi:hypothetical protein
MKTITNNRSMSAEESLIGGAAAQAHNAATDAQTALMTEIERVYDVRQEHGSLNFCSRLDGVIEAQITAEFTWDGFEIVVRYNQFGAFADDDLRLYAGIKHVHPAWSKMVNKSMAATGKGVN